MTKRETAAFFLAPLKVFQEQIHVYDSPEYRKMMDEFQQQAEEYGYFEADYLLGKLRQNEGHMEEAAECYKRGYEKGCLWSGLEYARYCREYVPEQYPQILLRIADYRDLPEKLSVELAAELSDFCREGLQQNWQSRNMGEMMRIYLKILDGEKLVYKNQQA